MYTKLLINHFGDQEIQHSNMDCDKRNEMYCKCMKHSLNAVRGKDADLSDSGNECSLED